MVTTVLYGDQGKRARDSVSVSIRTSPYIKQLNISISWRTYSFLWYRSSHSIPSSCRQYNSSEDSGNQLNPHEKDSNSRILASTFPVSLNLQNHRGSQESCLPTYLLLRVQRCLPTDRRLPAERCLPRANLILERRF